MTDVPTFGVNRKRSNVTRAPGSRGRDRTLAGAVFLRDTFFVRFVTTVWRIKRTRGPIV